MRRETMKKLKKDFLRDWQLHLIILIPIIHLLLFHYGPMYGAQIAFRDYRAKPELQAVSGLAYNGLKNF